MGASWLIAHMLGSDLSSSGPLTPREKAAASAVWIPRSALLSRLSKAATEAGAELRFGCSVSEVIMPEALTDRSPAMPTAASDSAGAKSVSMDATAERVTVRVTSTSNDGAVRAANGTRPFYPPWAPSARGTGTSYPALVHRRWKRSPRGCFWHATESIAACVALCRQCCSPPPSLLP